MDLFMKFIFLFHLVELTAFGIVLIILIRWIVTVGKSGFTGHSGSGSRPMTPAERPQLDQQRLLYDQIQAQSQQNIERIQAQSRQSIEEKERQMQDAAQKIEELGNTIKTKDAELEASRARIRRMEELLGGSVWNDDYFPELRAAVANGGTPTNDNKILRKQQLLLMLATLRTARGTGDDVLEMLKNIGRLIALIEGGSQPRERVKWMRYWKDVISKMDTGYLLRVPDIGEAYDSTLMDTAPGGSRNVIAVGNWIILQNNRVRSKGQVNC
jgi:hypothetical protein